MIYRAVLMNVYPRRTVVDALFEIDEKNLSRDEDAPSCILYFSDKGFNPPKKHFKRSERISSTERGWEEFGREMVSFVRKNGYDVKVVRKKNPKRSDVAYSDPYQVAINSRRSK